MAALCSSTAPVDASDADLMARIPRMSIERMVARINVGRLRYETARAREAAARELDQLRADAERERDEILARLTDTASRLLDA